MRAQPRRDQRPRRRRARELRCSRRATVARRATRSHARRRSGRPCPEARSRQSFAPTTVSTFRAERARDRARPDDVSRLSRGIRRSRARASIARRPREGRIPDRRARRRCPRSCSRARSERPGSSGTPSSLRSSEDFRVVRYDHPGHGRSPTPESHRSPSSRWPTGVVELLDALELERVSFCGLSLGGMVGMALALRAPERLDRLVLCCTAAHLGPVEGWYERARGRASRRDVSDRGARCSDAGSRERFRDESPVTVARFREMLEGTPAEGYAACCEAIARWDARSDVSAIRTPTLVIAGDDDVATPPAGRRVPRRDRSPAPSSRSSPSCAHLANVEQPTLFTRALLGHLRVPAGTEAT